jgi:2-haloacid dehalogenase
MPIKGLIFDAYGTLYDVHSVQAKTAELCPGKDDLITQIWRLKQLEYTWLQTALRLHNAVLGYTPDYTVAALTDLITLL